MEEISKYLWPSFFPMNFPGCLIAVHGLRLLMELSLPAFRRHMVKNASAATWKEYLSPAGFVVLWIYYIAQSSIIAFFVGSLFYRQIWG
jgi:hypothetical protein